MPNLDYTVVPPADARVLDGLRQIGTEVGAGDRAQLEIRVFDNSQPLTIPLAKAAEHTVLKPILDLGGSTIKYLRVQYGEPQVAVIALNRSGPLFNVSVHVPDNVPADKQSRTVAVVRKTFQEYEPTPHLDTALGPALAEFHRAREGSLASLERIAHDVVEGTTAARRELEAEFEAYRAKLREETAAERERLERESQTRHERLAKEKADLDAQRKEIDDRKNTIARRQLRADLKQEIANRNKTFDLTKAAKRKRLPVHGLFLLLIALSATYAGVSLNAANTATGTDLLTEVLPTVRFALAMISLVGAIIFYIRWNDQWARQHADEEFQLKRLDLDIDRASWVVETALEWKEEKEFAIPQELLDRLSANLFQAGASRRPRHPAEDVSAALLKASKGLTLNVPGFGQITLDNRGIRQFAREVSGDEKDGAKT